MKEIEQKRLEKANELLSVIGNCGQKFFNHKGEISRLELDSRGRVWFIDSYSKKRVYTHYGHRWRGFTNGGTLRSLIIRLRKYIKTGEMFVLPAWQHWAYENDIEIVLTKGEKLGITKATYPSLKQVELSA